MFHIINLDLFMRKQHNSSDFQLKVVKELESMISKRKILKQNQQVNYHQKESGIGIFPRKIAGDYTVKGSAYNMHRKKSTLNWLLESLLV